jgi:hypothetical protein
MYKFNDASSRCCDVNKTTRLSFNKKITKGKQTKSSYNAILYGPNQFIS